MEPVDGQKDEERHKHQQRQQHRREQHAERRPRSGSNKGKLKKQGGSGGQQKKGQSTPGSPLALMSSVAITNRVYILGLEDSKRITVKEVMYVDIGKSTNFASDKSGGRPYWIPEHIPADSWSADPPCYWKNDSFALQDLESSGANLMYNPLVDYTLEFIRWYRSDLFESIFHLFTVWSKKTYNERQLALLKDTIKPQSIMVDDFDAHFNADSPAAATLKKATLGEDVLPEIEHYLALLNVRAFRLRNTMVHIK